MERAPPAHVLFPLYRLPGHLGTSEARDLCDTLAVDATELVQLMTAADAESEVAIFDDVVDGTFDLSSRTVRRPVRLERVRFNGLVPGSTRVLYDPFNGDRRVAALNGLDVRLEKALRFGGTAEGAVFGDFLNVFNNDAYESIIDRRQVSTNFGVPTRFVLPRRLMIGAKFRF